jgi:hypothetical protein
VLSCVAPCSACSGIAFLENLRNCTPERKSVTRRALVNYSACYGLDFEAMP